mgnify:CR=1 FL=1
MIKYGNKKAIGSFDIRSIFEFVKLFSKEFLQSFVMVNKKTLVIGGSPKPSRYSNMAIRKLLSYGHTVESIGLKVSQVENVVIQSGKPNYSDIHTVAMYIGPRHQHDYYKYLLDLKPMRIIFNPGTENKEFATVAAENGIEVIEHCTLVMLNDGLF